MALRIGKLGNTVNDALYELVCDREGRLQDGLEFGACMDSAQTHNKKTGHYSDCFPEGTPEDEIQARFRAVAAARARAAARAGRAS